tara:strand:+ start:747 stop:1313 length:567 start_codon:yes stop_codon:yes gene_type:complete
MSDILLNSLKGFYTNKENKQKLFDIINNTNNISLRIIDWFVTNYSKKYNTSYFMDSNKLIDEDNKDNSINTDNLKQFNVYYSYKTQLKSYSKKKFDPFCRRDRIEFTVGGETIISTIGQLNFFKWAINNSILDYIKINYKCIENDMNICYNSIHKKKEKNIRKKRQEISKSATRGLNSNNIKVVIDFD